MCPAFEIPACEEGEWRREESDESAVLNGAGYVDCEACNHVDCPDFVVPDCTEGDYRPETGDANE
jgi:hypothetical protein